MQAVFKTSHSDCLALPDRPTDRPECLFREPAELLCPIHTHGPPLASHFADLYLSAVCADIVPGPTDRELDHVLKVMPKRGSIAR